MEEYHQITLDEWTQWKEDIRKKLAETAQNFVYIGYRLKQIRDSGMFGGTADIFEFAQNEYGLGKSTVSRFIAINEKYSKEGNSLELKDEYKGFSSSKLSEMLTLPDSECELITEKTTIKDIRELKNFDRQAPVEATAEAAGYSPLELCVIDYFKDRKDMLNELLKNYYNFRIQGAKAAAECMNPSGCATHSKGICFLFMYEYEKGIKYKLLMQQEPVSMNWEDFLEIVWKIYEDTCLIAGKSDVYSEFYHEEPESVATSQQEEAQAQETRKPEPIAENENAENKPLSENEESAKSVIEMDEADSEEEQKSEESINTEFEETKNAQMQETRKPEPIATSQQEIKNPAAFRNAKDALVRLNQAFDEGKYERVLDMADAFIMHLERAIR